MTKLIDYSVGL